MPNFKKTRGFSLKSGNKPSMSSFKMMGASNVSPITSPNLKVDWDKAPAVGTQERADWYKKNNLAQDDTTKVKGANSKSPPTNEPEVNVTETDADKITSGNAPKVNKFKTGASKMGGVLAGAFTSGLDAVYGTGRVVSGGEIKFSKAKKKKDDTTGEEKVNKLLEK